MPNVEQTFGAMFMGVLVSMIIYGITVTQSHFYYANHPKDDHGEKALVAGIWILETTHIVLLSHTLYTYLISGYGDERVLLEGTWSLFTSVAVNVTVAFTVQCYFTRCIFTLSPGRYKWWILFITGLFVFAHLFFGIEMAVYFFIKKEFIRFRDLRFQILLPFLIMAVSSDVLIAAALCLLGDRSEFDDANSTPNTLVVYAINRCILTCAVAIARIVVVRVSMLCSIFTGMRRLTALPVHSSATFFLRIRFRLRPRKAVCQFTVSDAECPTCDASQVNWDRNVDEFSPCFCQRSFVDQSYECTKSE